MKRYLLVTLFALSCVPIFSQDTIQLYMDENAQQVDSKRKAVFIRKAFIREDHYILQDQYINGEMINYGEFISVNPFIEDGLSKHYNSGKLYSSGNYKNGKLTGKWIYVNGNYVDTVDYSLVENYFNKLKDTCEIEPLMKECSTFTNDTNKILDDLAQFIKCHSHLPSRARELTESLNCYVNFYIDTTGCIKCPEITNCSSIDYTYELMRVLFLYKANYKIRTPLKLSLPIYRENEPSFVFVEKQAAFQSGTMVTFQKWVQNNLVYPSSAIANGKYGTVTVQFAVTSKGELVDVKILFGVDYALDKEAYRVVLSSPKWEAAEQGGRAVRQQFVMPVFFKLPE